MHSNIKRFLSIFTIVSIVTVGFAGCGASAVDFATLTGSPAVYNGKVVTFDAFYFSGFEIQALAGGLTHPAGSTRWTPVQPLIWVTGVIPQTVLDDLRTQSDTPSGYPEYYGKIRVTGKFEYGGKYGHMDAYSYRLVATGAAALAWTP